MTITLLDNKYATLLYHPNAKIVHHKFHQPIADQTFRAVLEKGLEVFQQYGAHKWLSDDRSNSALRPEDSEWRNNDWSPRVIAAGWKVWAIVLPARIIGQLNMQPIIKQGSEHGITTRAFSDPDEAMAWLEREEA